LEGTEKEKMAHLPEEDKFLFQLCIADYANKEEQYKRIIDNEKKKTGLIIKMLGKKIKALENSRSLK
jgi:hemerythrin-like domain-containing protein